ncbi:multidrug resistance-associated ABC transporter [Pholiota molesta]|nr:multidrug resistance-associated ABC transporter [Pholiota molesta]
MDLSSWDLQQPVAYHWIPPDSPNRWQEMYVAIRVRATEHGGWTIFLFATARLIGCVTLLVLSSITLSRHFDATYTEVPIDAYEGRLIWMKIISVFVTAVLIPLFVPTKYIPVDPKNPMPVPNAEQTTSLFSFMVYSFMDPIILMGARTDHLSPDQLPPLCDTDASKHLINKSFPHVDPFKKLRPRHLFFGLLRVFRRDYTLLALSLTLMSATDFLSPTAIYHILSYLERGGIGENIRPWFWLLLLFAGPMLSAGLFQWYIFIATRMLTHAEGILTELVFEHSLRIRFTTEEANTQQDKDNATVVGTPSQDNASTVGETDDEVEPSDDSQSTTSEVPAKGKTKAPTPTPAVAATPIKEEDKKKDGHLIGKINNLVTADLNNITSARDFLFLVWMVPLQITLCTIFLYRMLGWSSFVGTGCMILLMPAPGYAAKLIQDVQRNKMKKTDARVQAVTEVVNALRMVKLFGWERKMSKRIRDARDEELLAIWWLKVSFSSIIPTISMLVTYATFTVIMKQELTSSIIFSSLTVFYKLRTQLSRISWQITTSTQGKVSLDRVNDFLKETELLDTFTDTKDDCSFVWSLGAAASRRSYRLRVDDELFFKPDCINLIIGPTGSGKTSMLMALLGEMHFLPNSADSWFNLPREGGVAYAAQESWVQNETIRSNILFGSPYDEIRYRKVLHQCALDKDLSLFEAGDNTEVGEKGITLRFARVTLARAIYSRAQIILLDDVLAALDVHTAAWIVENCFKGDLVKDRTVLLVTHNIALVSPLAKFIVSIGQDGFLSTQGTNIDVSLNSDPILAEEARHDLEELEFANEEATSLAKEEAPVNGKLVLAEEVAKGRVTWKSMKLFLSGLGGEHPIIFFGLWIGGFLLAEATYTSQKWFLGYWGSQYENHTPSEVRVSFYCTIYSCIVILTITLSNMSYYLYVSGTMKASRTINTLLVESVLGSTLRWLDQTPTARIITRFTQDIQMVDGAIPQGFSALTNISIAMVASIGVIMVFTPVFIIPGLFVAALGFYLGNMYLKAQLSAQREKSNARSPVLAHFSAAIAGIVSIRAYGAQEAFKTESLKRIDHHIRMARVTYNLNRWITVGLAAILIYGKPIGASNTGLSLNMAAEFCSMILYFVRIFNDFEVQSNSLERIQSYIDIDHEPASKDSGKPPAAWPTSDGPKILHDLSFHVESGQRVGIVGRTGSGKSSLTLALLRCIITEGIVYYDGIPTNTINLDALRSSITIIPQVPELISGTLRRNLDPFDQFDDATLNDALRSAGLFSLQEELGEARITLDSNITIGGGNLSVGEKQILALARAMIRGSKLLILDEDYKTDAVIQTTLRHELDPDVTVLTVAHRLQTIMDADKVMVLDEGNISEFDTPKALLGRENSLFKALVDESGDKDALYEIVERKGASASSSL